MNNFSAIKNDSLRGDGGFSRIDWRLMLLAIFCQLLLLAWVMPFSQLFSGNWFFHIDYPYHIYQTEFGRALQLEGRWSGYDPFFAAGYAGGLSSNLSARAALLFAYLLPASVSTASVYAVYVATCSLLAPLSLWGLARVLKWPWPRGLFAILLGMALWWVGVAHWYHTAGMVSFVLACYVAPWYAAWTYALCDSDAPAKPAALLGAGLVGGAGMWLHPLFCIPAVLVFLSFFLVQRKGGNFISLLSRALVVAVPAVLLSLPWVLAIVRDSWQAAEGIPYQTAVGLKVFLNSIGFQASGQTGAWINLLVLLMCVMGLVFFRRGSGTALARVFALAGAGLLVLAVFAAASNTGALLQPNRLIVPAYLLLAISVACHAEAVFQWTRADNPQMRTGILVVAGLLLAVFVGREWVRELQYSLHGRHGQQPPEISAAPQLVAKLESWITNNTDAQSRILFQTSLGRIHGGGHVAGYLASATRREFLGGSYPGLAPQVSCWDKKCFGRPIDTMDQTYFRRTLETYNVGWIIAHSSELKHFLEAMPDIKLKAVIDGVSVYEVQSPRTYVFAGQGRVSGRDFNRIELKDVSGSALTLRYNWVPGLETVPPSRIEPYTWSSEFPPLIRILDPPPNFVLRMGR